MNRDQLLDIATRLLAWINATPVEESKLEALAAKDIVVPIPYPGTTADFAGLVHVTTKIHEVSPDWKMTLTQAVVDEKESRVVFLLRSTGTQEGYCS